MANQPALIRMEDELKRSPLCNKLAIKAEFQDNMIKAVGQKSAIDYKSKGKRIYALDTEFVTAAGETSAQLIQVSV